MKFTQVNNELAGEQIKQVNDVTETIIKLKRVLAEQRLFNKAFGKYFLEQKTSDVNI